MPAIQNRRRVAISGIGVVSPNGFGAENYYQACINGTSGISRYEPTGNIALKTSAVAAVRDFEVASVLDVAEARRVPRTVHLALAASREALASAKIAIDPDDFETQRTVGVVLGTGGGGLAFVEDQYRTLFSDGRPSLYSITGGTHGNLSSELSIALKLRGPSHVISTGCASSTDALHYASMLIQAGIVSRVLVGGADAPIAPGILNAFEKMKVISTRRWDDPRKSSRPFCLDRDGFVLGEGAWMFVLEDLESARERGMTPVVELAGYGSTCDAYHRVQIAPETVEPVRAMQMALLGAGARPEDVDYVNLHGTGTELNDRMETLAIRKCLGERADLIPMSSTKSMIGHPQGACGAAGVAITALSMMNGRVHPTVNLEVPDLSCDLDYCASGSRAVSVDVALCNCIAFGSKNSAIVLRRIFE